MESPTTTIPIAPTDVTPSMTRSDTLESFPEFVPNPVIKHQRVRLHFIRHAQAEHNAAQSGEIHNPRLTKDGLFQCSLLRVGFKAMSRITHIFASPLSRTLETALHSFVPQLHMRKIKIVAWDGLRELGDAPCNHGDKLADLEKIFCGWPIDFSLIHVAWEDETTKSKDEAKVTVEKVKNELYDLVRTIIHGGIWHGKEYKAAKGDIEMVFVSHGTFMHKLTGVTYDHCDFRTFRLGNEGLIETDRSRQRVHKARKQAKEAAEKAAEREKDAKHDQESSCLIV